MMDNMIEVRDLQVTLSGKTIVQHMDADIPKGKITAIIGPNGCGKSTTLKAICRINPISAGQITLIGKNVWDYSYKEFAQKLAILTQSPQAPADMTVRDLVSMGRFPYRSFFGKATKEEVATVLESCVGNHKYEASTVSCRPCPAVNDSAPGLPWPWPRNPRYYCWMNLPLIWISATSWKS